MKRGGKTLLTVGQAHLNPSSGMVQAKVCVVHSYIQRAKYWPGCDFDLYAYVIGYSILNLISFLILNGNRAPIFGFDFVSDFVSDFVFNSVLKSQPNRQLFDKLCLGLGFQPGQNHSRSWKSR